MGDWNTSYLVGYFSFFLNSLKYSLSSFPLLKNYSFQIFNVVKNNITPLQTIDKFGNRILRIIKKSVKKIIVLHIWTIKKILS